MSSPNWTRASRRGIELCFAEMKDPVKDKLKRSASSPVSARKFFATIGEAVRRTWNATRSSGRTGRSSDVTSGRAARRASRARCGPPEAWKVRRRFGEGGSPPGTSRRSNGAGRGGRSVRPPGVASRQRLYRSSARCVTSTSCAPRARASARSSRTSWPFLVSPSMASPTPWLACSYCSEAHCEDSWPIR